MQKNKSVMIDIIVNFFGINNTEFYGAAQDFFPANYNDARYQC